MFARIVLRSICCTLVPFFLFPAGTTAADILGSLSELAAKRELWPAEVTILRGAEFQNGRSVRNGQVVVLDEVKPDGLRLDDGAMFFMYAEKDTDVMKRVAEMTASLTPDQLALTMDDVRRRDELWPTRAALRWEIQTGGNAKIAAGQELVMMGFQPDGQFLAGDIAQNITVPVDPWFTDLFARARDRVGSNDVTPFSLRLLESMLEPSADGSTVGDYDYVVMYDGRDSCSRSVDFAPELAAFQAKVAASDATWLLVFVNGASTPLENRAHYRNMRLDGRAAKDGWGPAVYRYFDIGGYETPWVHVFDSAGKEVAAAGSSADSARKVLDVLVANVREPIQ